MLTNHRATNNNKITLNDSDVDDNVVLESLPITGPDRAVKQKKKALPTANHLNGKISTVDKREELAAAKLKALDQLENTMKRADIIDNKNLKIADLQTEVKSVKQELKQSQHSLLDSTRVNNELMYKLQSLTDTNTRQRIDLENLRADNLTVSPPMAVASADAGYSRYLTDVIQNRDNLMVENNELLKTIEEQQHKLYSLQSYVNHLEGDQDDSQLDYKHIEETTNDIRSKSELLKVIRSQMDDKMVWMEYSIKLTKEAMIKCPQLFDLGTDSEMERQCFVQGDDRWVQFAIIVLQKVSRLSPEIMRNIIKSADSDQIKYLESRLK